MTLAIASYSMAQSARNLELAEVLERLFGGRSNRDLERETMENGFHVSHTSIGNIRWGSTPTYKLLTRLLEGLRVPTHERAEIYRAAGFAPPVPASDGADTELALSGADAFYEEFRRLQADYPHLPIPLPHFSGGVRSIKGPDEAREIVAGMRRRVEQGLFGDPRRPDEGKG